MNDQDALMRAQQRLLEARAAHKAEALANAEAGRLLLRSAAGERALEAPRVSPSFMAAYHFARGFSRAIEEAVERMDARGIAFGSDESAAILWWDPGPEWTDVQRAVREGIKTLFICGDKGVGKSSILAFLVFAWKRGDGPSPRMMAAEDLLEALEHPYDDERRHLVKVANEARCIAIDDLFRVPVTEAALERLRGLVARRMTRGLTTLVSTNVSGSDIVTRFSDGPTGRLTDRLRVAGRRIEMRGRSRRVGRASK